MFAKLAVGGDLRSPRNKNSMVGEMKAKGKKKVAASSTGSTEEESFVASTAAPKIRAENLQDYEPSELVHGLISESSSAEISSSSSSSSSDDEEESVAQQTVESTESTEDDEEDEVEFEGAYGCMDGFFMPGRAAAAKKSLIELNEKGEKELKFNMKLPIAMGFHSQAMKKVSENKYTSNRDDSTVDDNERKNIRSLGSMLSCRADNCRTNQHDLQATVDGFPVPQIRHQTTDPPAKMAGRKEQDPTDQFRSLMSLSHDSSAADDDDSHSNVLRTENFVLPPPPPPPPFHMQQGQQHYYNQAYNSMMHGQQQQMHPGAWYQQQNMIYPPKPPVTVNNTYETLVVNGTMPQQQQQQLPFGAPHGYWNGQQRYMGHHHPAMMTTSNRQMEPPAIEKLPSQIVVEQQEDKSIGEDSSYFSYDAVPVPEHPYASKMQMNQSASSIQQQQRVQSGYQQTAAAKVLQSSHQFPYGNAQHFSQQQESHNTGGKIPMKPIQNSYNRHAQRQHNHIGRMKGKHDELSNGGESEDDFQDSVQVLSDELGTASSSTSGSNEGRLPKVQRWRQANLRRLKGPASKPSSTNPRLEPVSSTPSNEPDSNSPSFDEAPRNMAKEKRPSVDDSSVDATHTTNEDDDDTDSSDSSVSESSEDESNDNDDAQSQDTINSDESSVDSDQAIVETETAKSHDIEPKKKDSTPKLQPVQEEEENASTASLDKTFEKKETTKESIQESPEEKLHSTTVQANTKESRDQDEQPKEGGGYLMFDSIYTRRRERRDAAKKKMNRFLEAREPRKAQILDDKNQRSGLSRITSALLGTKTASPANSHLDREMQDELSVEEEQAPTQSDSMLPTPQRENKSVVPQIKTVESTDAVLQSALDVPGLSSPLNVVPKGPESPSKSVSMAPLPPNGSFSERNEIKMSLSLKPTMTSEFHDAMSTASESTGAPSQDGSSGALQLQPTMTNEWHDTIQSPTTATCNGADVLDFETACPSGETSSDDESEMSKEDDANSADIDLQKFSESFDASCEVE